jgi:hypothetical protein
MRHPRLRSWSLLALLAVTGCAAAGVGDNSDGAAPDAAAADAALQPDLQPACVPMCAGKDCGDDGCEGSCGSCSNGNSCGDSGKCVPQCPCFYGECPSCYCATAAEQYAVQHNCAISVYAGNEGALLSCSGNKTDPATWTVGQKCSNGCVVAKPMVPDYCAPPPNAGHNLWIAFDGATNGQMNHTRDFFNCVFQHSNFNQLTAAFPDGRPFGGVGGIATLNAACATVHPYWCATVADDSATLQCIEDQTNWPLAPDDVVLYYPTTATKNNCDVYNGGCADGRNHWHIPVKLQDGSSVSVEAAFGFTGAGANCQTALGLHEVFEASAEASAADCCNGQQNCKGQEPDGPYGWYSGAGCGQTWELQNVSPSQAQEWNPGACTHLTFK